MTRKMLIKHLLYAHLKRYCNSIRVNLKDLREMWFQATGVTYSISVMNECLEELGNENLLDFERENYYEICIVA